MDQLVADLISRMGLALPVAILVAVRAGQMIHQMNSINMEQKINELTRDTLRERIVSKVELLLRVYKDTTPSFDLELPPIQPLTQQILFTEETIPNLNSLYTNLMENGTQAEFFLQILQLIVG